MFEIFLTKQALKDLQLLKSQPALLKKANNLTELLKTNPFQNPPLYEKLLGDLDGLYSRRINIQHRLVYSVNEIDKKITILSLWTHYDKI
jgi:Txe/YoeB family toxin of toxin-antitoxin system